MKIKKTAFLVSVLLIILLGESCPAIQENQEGNMILNENSPDQIIQSVIYEAVFLDKSDVESVFEEIRGKLPPYEHVTQDYHVTTAFYPETDARELYGSEVEVRIIGYKSGEVAREDEVIVGCEGLKVELFSENEEMINYLINAGNDYHVTGSYSDHPKYTGFMDFSDMEPMNVVLKGRFGAFLTGADYNSAFITFDADQVGKVIEEPSPNLCVK